ncbi:MAG: hypothetical protein N2Z63_00920 [Thiobacillaceae bacterium]|nr:hypothetical protein [Thiobacillaceae bacterium]
MRPMGQPGERGATLIEAVIFMAIIGVAAAAIVGVYAQAGRAGAELATRFEAQQLAHALMQEVLARPARCGSLTPGEAFGPEPGETRATPFDHVNDYHGFDTGTAGPRFLSGEMVDADGDGRNDLAGYRVRVSVRPLVYGGVPAVDSLRVTVTVTPPAGADVVLEALRFCHLS